MSTRSSTKIPTGRSRAEILSHINDLQLLSRTSPQEAFDRASELAATLGDDDPYVRACALVAVAEACDNLGLADEMQRAMTSMAELIDRIDVPMQRAWILYGLGACHHIRGQIAEAHVCFQEALDLAKSAGDHRWADTVVRNLGMLAHNIGEYDRALQLYLQVLANVDDASHHHFVVVLLSSIGQVYADMREDGKALEYYERSLCLARRHDERVMEASVLNDVALLHLNASRVSESIEALRMSSEIWHQLGSGFHYLATLSTLVDAYLRENSVDQAEQAAAQASELAESSGNWVWMIQSLLKQAAVLERQGELERAEQACRRALDLAVAERNRPRECDVCEVLARVCAAREKFEEAYTYRTRAGELTIALLGEERQKEFKRAEQRHAIDISRREREMLQLRAERAEQAVELQAKELSAAALALTKRNEALQNLRAIVRPLSLNEKGRARTVAASVLERIEEVMTSRDEWGVFEEQFEKVHHDFIVRLRERCVTLTPTEIRVCVLLRLNLATKQIADILCCSPDTIKVHRKHIRKKLDVVADDNLTSLFLGLR